ncbi:MAG: methyl-accepting chemotaxis protein [Bacillota bacterium]|nr:methyl-accepting chemotaxis protein [Bacillota bacterium]
MLRWFKSTIKTKTENSNIDGVREQFQNEKEKVQEHGETEAFIQSTNGMLEEVVKQHHIVNSQHLDLANLAEKVKIHMKSIFDLTIGTNKSTDALYNESKKLTDITDGSAGKAREGKRAIEEMTDILRGLEEENRNSMNSIRELVERFKKVHEIVNLISGISSKTNLLALNAAIEAARSGEHGKGFAVVAEEVRKLAEMTKSQTGDISDLIKDIEGVTKKVIDNSNKYNSVINNGVEMSGRALDKIEASLSSVSDIEREVKEVMKILSSQKHQINEMNREIADIDEVLKETSDTIIRHIEEAKIVDNHLEDTKKNLTKFGQGALRDI